MSFSWTRISPLLVLCLSVLLLTLAVRQISAVANVDTLEPVIRLSPAKGDDDLFGYSVVLHQVTVPPAGDFDAALASTRIVVGAPLGTFPGGLASLDTGSQHENETGLVYQCGLSDTQCGPVGRTGTAASNRRLFDDQPDSTDLINGTTVIGEQKRGQLLGQSLRSSGDYFLACAPRWLAVSPSPEENFDNRKTLGRCFLSGRDLSSFAEVRPCLGDNRFPTYTNSGTNRCQAGFGASFYTDTGSQTRLLVSGVGIESGRGGVYIYDDPSSLVSSPESITTTSGATGDVSMSPGGSIYSRSSLYDGWSVTTGALSPGSISYISGMPRFDGFTNFGKINIRSPSSPGTITNNNLTFIGQQLGEYYGHAVITADLNNDGYDEVIVGAPTYADNGNPDTGRVFVYRNEQGTLNPEAIILTGNTELGRFGHTLINLGDVNGDDIQDIAIGAPYASTSNPNATGILYIYYGDVDNVISRNPSQIISSDSVLGNLPGVNELKSFGFSMSGGVDVDANGYDDLIVGAYDSQAAVLFRTRSVARITFDLMTDNDTVTVDTDSDFVVTLCASYEGRGLDGRPLNISYRLIEQAQVVGVMSIPRITFKDSGMSTYTGFLNFNSTGVRTCVDVTAQLKPFAELPNGIDLRDPIVILVEFNALERMLSPDPSTQFVDFRDFPLLRSSGNFTTSITPVLSCASRVDGEVCTPDLFLELLSTVYRSGNSIIPGRNSIVAGEVTAIQFSLRVSNLADEPAVNSFLSFTLPGGQNGIFSSPQLQLGDMEYTCTNPNQGSEYRCTLPPFIRPGMVKNNIMLEWAVDSSNLVGNEPNINATISVRIPDSPDIENVTSNNDITAVIPIDAITSPSITFTFSGPLNYPSDPPVSIPPTFNNLGPSVEISARVRNAGPSSIPNAIVEINLPTLVPNEAAYYLYVGSIAVNGGDRGVTCNQEFVNPERLSVNSGSRRKRSLSKRQTTSTSSTMQSCSFDNPSAACQNFRCNVTDFGTQDFTVLIFTVLDSRYFESQNANFEFEAFARVTSLNGFDDYDTNMNDNSASSTYTVSPVPPKTVDIKLEIWLPIICGILALIVIIVIFTLLIYCGFFRKKKLEDAKKKQAEGGEFEVRQVPPEAAAVVTGEDPTEEKNKDDYGPGVEPSKDADIGDTADLQDGEVADPEKDAEETSL